MTVADQVDQPTNATSEPMDPQAAAELAQELTLVAKSLFAQLLPSTSAHAITGVPGLGGPDPVVDTQAATHHEQATTAAASVASPPAVDVPATPASVPMPSAGVPVPPVAVPQVPAPAPMAPAAALPVPDAPAGIPVPTLAEDPEPTVPTTATPGRQGQHSLAMLEEIGFLDE